MARGSFKKWIFIVRAIDKYFIYALLYPLHQEDVARRAHVKVCNAPTGGGEIDLGVPAPYAVAANNDYIAVGMSFS